MRQDEPCLIPTENVHHEIIATLHVICREMKETNRILRVIGESLTYLEEKT